MIFKSGDLAIFNFNKLLLRLFVSDLVYINVFCDETPITFVINSRYDDYNPVKWTKIS